MKLWPQKRWKKIVLSTLLIILAVFVSIGAYFEYSVYREITSSTEILNSEGSKKALVIYHPGLSDFAHDIAYAYANGLVSTGWRVDISTVSQQTPTDLSNYQLLVLGWPIYDFSPGPTVTNYMNRIGNLNGINTTIIEIGGGIDPLEAHRAMKNIVQNANGTIIQSLTSFRSQHNQDEIQLEASKLTI